VAQRSGSADLPLHGGRVPAWLAERMARLGRLIVEAIVLEYGRDELLRRLAHPFWFQSLGAVMGMDWHSSGITTSVLGALKRGLAPVAGELGLWVCGGRGRHSRRTPEELLRVGERTGIDGSGLARISRLVAKVDSAAVQDGFDLYLHGFVVAADGRWTVVQQGMSAERKEARRYHWLSEGLRDFVDAPHAAIAGEAQGEIVNLTDHRAAPSRRAQLELVAGGAEMVLGELRRIGTVAARSLDGRGQAPPLRQSGDTRMQVGRNDGALPIRRRGGARPRPSASPVQLSLPLPHLDMPAHHEVRREDVDHRRLAAAFAAAAARGPVDYPELLLTPGVGARTVAALALVAEVVHGAPCRFADPARFAYAHGGKDGHPFPVPLPVYDRTLEVMRQAVTTARLGNDEKLAALRRLDAEARRLEAAAG
jgi:hypothetical protein